MVVCTFNVWLTSIFMRVTGTYEQLAAPTFMLIFIGLLSFTNASIFLNNFHGAVVGMMSCAAIDMINGNYREIKGPKTFHAKIRKIMDCIKKVSDEDKNLAIQ